MVGRRRMSGVKRRSWGFGPATARGLYIRCCYKWVDILLRDIKWLLRPCDKYFGATGRYDDAAFVDPTFPLRANVVQPSVAFGQSRWATIKGWIGKSRGLQLVIRLLVLTSGADGSRFPCIRSRRLSPGFVAINFNLKKMASWCSGITRLDQIQWHECGGGTKTETPRF